MANKVTHEDIKKMNQLYLKLKTYAAVSREVGFSPSTVKKYIIPNFTEIREENIIRFDCENLPKFSAEKFEGIDNFGDLCLLSTEEVDEIRELWNELEV